MAKLKDLIEENFSVVGGVVSTPAISRDYGSLTKIVEDQYGEVEEERVDAKQVMEALSQYNEIGKSLYMKDDLRETAEKLSQIAQLTKNHTLSETEDWFDKVTVNRNMKELTNFSKQFGKISSEAQAVRERLATLYEDMGNILNRYYDIPEVETHDADGVVSEKDGEYEKFFQGAMKKFGIKSPSELDDDEKKKFFNYVDANYKAKNEKD
jgi:virulence-associated protein VapD